MMKFDPKFARESLEALVGEFERWGREYPSLRHCVVEGPSKGDPVLTAYGPGSFVMDTRNRCHRFFEPGPPARMHYYYDVEIEHERETIEKFRNLACRAARIVEGWPVHEPGLPPALIIPFRATPHLEAEAWMRVVHRFAWLGIQGSPLRADVSVPEEFASGDSDLLPVGHPVESRGVTPSQDITIPGPCLRSILEGENVFLDSVAAIRAIGHLMDYHEPFAKDRQWGEEWISVELFVETGRSCAIGEIGFIDPVAKEVPTPSSSEGPASPLTDSEVCSQAEVARFLGKSVNTPGFLEKQKTLGVLDYRKISKCKCEISFTNKIKHQEFRTWVSNIENRKNSKIGAVPKQPVEFPSRSQRN